jgi:hypothetical protein
MLDRFVSVFSLTVATAAVALFGMFAWWIATGAMGEGDGVFAMAGCLLTAMVFAYRFIDPADVEAISVVKQPFAISR